MKKTLENEEGVEAETTHPSRDVTSTKLEIYDEDIFNPRKRPRDTLLPIFGQTNNPRIRPRRERYATELRDNEDGKADDEESWSTENDEVGVLIGS
jgi:hypothetical protein